MAVSQESFAENADLQFENCTLAKALADRMRSSSEDLTRRWLDRISARVRLDPNRVFPTDALLDHMPMLILGIADYIESPQRVVETLADMAEVLGNREAAVARAASGLGNSPRVYTRTVDVRNAPSTAT